MFERKQFACFFLLGKPMGEAFICATKSWQTYYLSFRVLSCVLFRQSFGIRISRSCRNHVTWLSTFWKLSFCFTKQDCHKPTGQQSRSLTTLAHRGSPSGFGMACRG